MVSKEKEQAVHDKVACGIRLYDDRPMHSPNDGFHYLRNALFANNVLHLLWAAPTSKVKRYSTSLTNS